VARFGNITEIFVALLTDTSVVALIQFGRAAAAERRRLSTCDEMMVGSQRQFANSNNTAGFAA